MIAVWNGEPRQLSPNFLSRFHRFFICNENKPLISYSKSCPINLNQFIEMGYDFTWSWICRQLLQHFNNMFKNYLLRSAISKYCAKRSWRGDNCGASFF